MSKRKKNKRNTPNIPQTTLDRARRQAAGQDVDAQLTAQRSEEKSKPRRKPPKRNQQTEQLQVSNRRERERLDSGALEQALVHPTKVVTAEDLRQAYGYVLSDLRNMGLLAGALMVVMVLLAQLI